MTGRTEAAAALPVPRGGSATTAGSGRHAAGGAPGAARGMAEAAVDASVPDGPTAHDPLDVAGPPASIFRPAAVARHRQGDTAVELPLAIRPRALRWLWLGVLGAGGLAWLAWAMPVPVLAACRATVVAWPFRAAPDRPEHVAVVRCRPEWQGELAVGQTAYLDVEAGGAPVRAAVAAVYPAVLSPAGLAARLRWPAAARCELTGPASVALVVLRPGWRLDPARLEGASFGARVVVGTRSAAALALAAAGGGGG